MIINKLAGRWQSFIIGTVGLIGTLVTGGNEAVFAQVIPDDTLGAESSVVNPDAIIRDILSNRIDGGATRGANLFHSFIEFNVAEGGGVYFTNPDGIENILSRVTGDNVSTILGRLGVLGEANLFLLNPNGILFGENASLDIEGSFVATTASGIELGEDGVFSATQPRSSRLLSVSPGALFYNAVEAAGGKITNRGNLTTGRNLTLDGENLDLQGQLRSGSDLTLQAQDTVTIRDSQTNPFIAAAGGNLLVTGNQGIDIFALNHPDSGLFSGGDMVLRSAADVGGDAHYWSGGSFRIEQLDGNLGNLYSPEDPVIRALGDVTLNNYTGASLHIFAGGGVNIGTVTITGADSAEGIRGDVTLSDGSTVVVIDGKVQPAVDVRAGLDPNAVGSPLGLTGDNFSDSDENFDDIPDSADITVGSVFVDAVNGVVFLSNQYQPNRSLSGDIQVGEIFTDDFVFTGNAGSVIIDSRGNINITNQIDSSSASGDAGDITLIADDGVSSAGGFIFSGTSGAGAGGDIRIQSESVLLTQGATVATATLGTGDAGNLTVETGQLLVQDGSQLITSTLGEGDGGEVNINATEIEFNGANPVNGNPSGLFANVRANATGNAGDVTLNTERLLVSQGGQIGVSTFGEGNGGELTVNASQIELNGTNPINGTPSGLFAVVADGATGNGGDVTISTQDLRILDGASLDATTFGKGDAGELRVVATDQIQVSGSDPEGNSSSIGAQVNSGATGNGGNLTLETGELLVSQGGQISVSTFGEGNGGELTVNTSQIELNGRNPINGTPSGLFASVEDGATGNGGNVSISTQNLRILDGAELSASTLGKGDAGELRVVATDQIQVSGSDPEGNSSGIRAQVNSGATGNAGNLTLETGELLVSQGSQISVGTFGEGNGGELKVNASQIELNGRNPIDNRFPSGLFAAVGDGATGDGGNVTISTQNLRILDGADLSASTLGEGNSGNLTVTAKDKIEVIGSPEGNASFIAAQVEPGATGNAGNLTLETGELLVSQGSQINVLTFGEGNGGQLTVNASQIELIGDNPINGNPSGLFAVVADNATGNGGDVTISTQDLRILDGAQLSASTFGEGNSGNLTVTAKDKIEVIGSPEGNASSIAAQVEKGATGDAGNLTLETGELLVSQGGQIGVGTFGEGNGGQLNVNASQIELIGTNPIDNRFPSALFASVEDGATGNGGNVSISTQGLRILEGANLSTGTAGMGDAGDVTVTATDKIEVIGTNPDGNPSSIDALVRASATGNGGNLTINTPSLLVTDKGLLSVETRGNGTAGNLLINTQNLTVTNNATVSAATSSPSPDGIGGNLTINASDTVQLTNQGRIIAQSTGAAKAGDIQINTEHLSATNGTIATSTEQSAGGAITITASDIRLFEDSDITSRVASGAGGGGNITLTADTILAFDDSDILAFARDGRGGDISLNTVAFFGENFKPAPRGTDPVTLDINSRVDINADGLVPGTITLPDTSFVENSFILLSGDGIDTDKLIAESCIARRHQPQRGSFFITGTGGIPFRPGDLYDTPYQTGTVRSIPSEGDGEAGEAGGESSSSTRRPWKMGDPIIEPTGIYRLANGKVIMSRLCGE